MSQLDVLLIGGYGLTEKGGGVSGNRDKIRLHSNGHLATVDFIKELVKSSGGLDAAEESFRKANSSKLVARSLNVIYLYDFLTRNGLKTEAVNYFKLEEAKFKSLAASNPKVIAISTTFMSDVADINEVAQAAKEMSPESVIIAGSIKVLKSFKKFTLFRQGYFDGIDISQLIRNNFFFDSELDKWIDVFVIEECGELTLLDLIQKIKSNQNFRNTPNIAYRRNGELTFTQRMVEPFTFATHPISWESIPEDILGYEIPVRAGMGCPFKCSFCDFVGLHKVRLRPIESVIDELVRIQRRFPGRPIYFTDDNLFTNKHRTTLVARAIIDLGLNFKWRAFFRADAISGDNIAILAASGLWSGALGVESGDDSILKKMRKGLLAETTLRSVHLLDSVGISTVSTMILGYPGETSETFKKTIDFLNSYPKPENAQHVYYPFCFMVPPLSPVATPESRRLFGLKGLLDVWEHFTMTSREAEQLLPELFSRVSRPTLLYPESLVGTPARTFNRLATTRDAIVRGGINVIDSTNSCEIAAKFAAALN